MFFNTVFCKLEQSIIRYFAKKVHNNALKIFDEGLFYIKCHLEKILVQYDGTIPILLVSYNNHMYVENIVRQLNELYLPPPIIIDNCSTSEQTIIALESLQSNHQAHVIFSPYNYGHMVGFLDPIYSILPNVFAYSDPDLQFNKNLPSNFLEIMADITKQYRVYKAGFALPTNIGGYTLINSTVNFTHQDKPFLWENPNPSIQGWESTYWRLPIKHPSLELYAAKIDTTFAVYNKQNYHFDFYDGIRIAGNYSAVHLPWFLELDMMNEQQKDIYLSNNKSTTWVQK